MAILIPQNNQKVYISSTGIVSDEEKKKADLLDADLKKELNEFERRLLTEKLLTKNGVKKDSLKVWYMLGFLLNKIANKYDILGTTDEVYYWQTIYNYISPLIQKKQPPKNYKNLFKNHFRLCAYMAIKDWNTVRDVGNWAVWRDILDNSILLKDKRVFDLVVEALKKKQYGHKEIRPFLHETRRRLTKVETKVLSQDELRSKLSGVDKLLP